MFSHLRIRFMKYREANVWIVARQLGLPFLVAEIMTEYLTGTKIQRNFDQYLPDIEMCISFHLSGKSDPDTYVVKHGFLPYRMYDFEEGREARYLFCKDASGEWYGSSAYHPHPFIMTHDFEYLAENDATVSQFWQTLFRIRGRGESFGNSVSCAHVEVDNNFRVVCFERAVKKT